MSATGHLRRTWDRDGVASTIVMRRACRLHWEMTPAFMLHRAREIARLPQVEWKGRRLYTIRCHGDFGKGPHDMNVPEALLWSLRSLQFFLCPYHR
jgi:hypothetical protein